MNRAEILAELEQIQSLIAEPVREESLAVAQQRLEALGEAIRLDVARNTEDCPFEPGRITLVGLQSRAPKPKKKKKQKAKARQQPAPARPKARPSGLPLTGRIAALVREGVPTEEIVALYRIKPEHVSAFVATFVTPVAVECELTRCPTPL